VRCFIGSWAGEPYASDVVADQQGKYLFVDGEAYKVGCAIDETPALFAGFDTQRPPRWANPFLDVGIDGAMTHQITADSARPETIDYMAKRGFIIQSAIKGPGSVEEGINFLKSYDIVVHPRCRRLSDEMVLYSWQTDRLTGDILPKLADRDNHVIDALRYALEGARKAIGGTFEYQSAGRREMADLDDYMIGIHCRRLLTN
jgi:phage terminase large subunit